MDLWEPVIPIAYDPGHVEETVAKFGDVVDAIENHKFSPPQLRALKKVEIKRETLLHVSAAIVIFGTHVIPLEASSRRWELAEDVDPRIHSGESYRGRGRR